MIALFILLLIPFARPSDLSEILLAPGVTEVVRRSDLIRVAIGNPKIAKVKIAGRQDILITGIVEGRTSLHLWKRKEQLESLTVRVLSGVLYEEAVHSGRADVVRVSLELLELDSSRLKELGLQWPGAIQFSAGGTFSNTSGLNYALTAHSSQGILRQLLSSGRAKRVAYPDLYVRLGEEATFHSGGELPVATSAESHGRYYRQVQCKPYGLTVRVKPKSDNGYHIHSDVRVELSHFNMAHAVDGIPAINKRHVETKLRSLDRQTVFLSGLLSQEESRSSEGLPLLGEIPLIGGLLFSGTKQTGGQNELLMAITYTLTDFSEGNGRLEQFRKEATP